MKLVRTAAVLLCLVSGAAPVSAQPSWNDTLVFSNAPFSELNALLEKTIFKVDVLELRLRVDSLAAADLRRLASPTPDAGVSEDSLALAVINAEDVLAEIRFLRKVSLSQFLDGIDEDMRKAVRAELLDEESYREIMADLPESFAFLESRRIQQGDRISYRLHGDTLRTVYREADGTTLLDQVDVGRQRRRSVLATFLAPGSSFRKDLMRSLRDPTP